MGRAHLYLLHLQRLTNCVKTYFPILNERYQNSRAHDSGAKRSLRHCAPPGKIQCISKPSFAGSLFHCFTVLFLFIDWWIHLTKYKHPVMTHFMYILFSLIFTSSFIFLFSMYLLFNLHISVFLSWHISLSFLTSITSGYFVLVLIFFFLLSFSIPRYWLPRVYDPWSQIQSFSLSCLSPKY